MNLCKFSKIGGEPGQGIHSYRIFDIAYIDLIFTLIGAYIIHYFYPKLVHPKYNLHIITAGFFIFGIVCHRLFCVRTTVDKFFFP